MQRLAQRLSSPGVDARVQAGMPPERWRELLSQGRGGRIWARLEAFIRFPAQVVVDATLGDGEVIIPTTNPFFLPYVVVGTRHLHGRTVIPLIYDLYPDAIEAAGLATPDDLVSRIAARLNTWMFTHADGVVFIGQRMADQAMDRYGTPKRYTILPTGAEVSEFTPEALGDRAPDEESAELEAWCARHTVAAYVGAMGHMHDWATLAEAGKEYFARDDATSLGKSKPLGLLIAASGPGVDRLKEAWADLPADQVRFQAPLSDKAWARLLATAPLALVTLKPGAHRTSMPSKAQSAIAAGAALVAVCPEDSDLGELVDVHRVGVRVDPGDDAALVEALRGYVGKPRTLSAARKRARSVAREHYDMPRLAGLWRTFIDEVRVERSRHRRPRLAKRAMDIVVAGAALAATAPIIGAAALAVRVNLGAPVLFEQDRPGLRGKTFKLRKFRTMRSPRPGEEGPDADAARLTPVGQFLRKTSIDELPTLLNVLAGDMTLVGPRPLLVRYLDRYSAEQGRRHDVVPGVTGWAQINGRNTISWADKFRLDVWYVDNQTLWRDLEILWKTAKKVLVREGISASEHVTMPEFTGTEADSEGADGAAVIDMARFAVADGGGARG